MGSLFSKQSIPSVASYSTTTAASTTASSSDTNTASTDTVSSDADKVKATIQKKRTLPQTIQTSYRGVLAQADFVPARKSLLGE